MIFNKKVNLAEKIYQNIVKISRSKFFYIDLNLDDSFETRFDLIVFHAIIIFYYYKSAKLTDSDISQKLFDHMFNDFENNLREMGFGDIAVNKKMKIFIKAFYGRLSNYSKGIDLQKKDDDKRLLQQSILNNILKGDNSNKDIVNKFTDYMISNIDNFLNKEESENLNNSFQFLNFE